MAIDVEISRRFPTFINGNLGTPNCATADPEAFFPERGCDRWTLEVAKRICNSCVYIGACREWAIENNEVGVWGGTTEVERKRLRRMRKAVKNARST
jgi:WhiB family redox-sensing transcriptional regulator